MVLVCGMDEAGRGPILGPLVMCGVLIAKEDEKKLKDLGVKDSKLMTPKQREQMFQLIKNIVTDFEIIKIQPKEIDEAVNSKTDNLNWLEARGNIKIMKKLKPDEVVIDCPSTNVKAFTEYLEKDVKNVKIHCAHHADRDFATVSAASILAKVTRDKEVEKIKEEIGIDFGSGYMSVPKTKAFLDKYWNKYPDLFRKSWQPYKNISSGESQSKLT